MMRLIGILQKTKHNKKQEKELLYKITQHFGKEVAIRVRKELKPTIKGSTYNTYVLRLNMVYQLLVEGVSLEDAIERAKKY
ncbi:hypothetical protein [Velocimicrobium porci]|uniref:Uncharacterized protein n=1 Tax=Velocimicrobium porci TaxID=2606634 RepID=A0A6L5Y0I8_9FIRM|nr:hypothetical protein [Velocimicrobium porci]MSS64585.1 hypothetical protein [Velocimicrobium porci]